MSIEAMQWAFKQNIKPSSVKFVLVSLGDNAQKDGLAWPSLADLTEKTGQDRKTVISALDRLEVMGYLVDTGDRKGRSGQVKIYRFNFNRVDKSTDFPESNSSESGTVAGVDSRNSGETVPFFPVDNSEQVPILSTESTEKGTVTDLEEYRFSHQRVPFFPSKSTVFPVKSTENGTGNPKNPNEPSMKQSGEFVPLDELIKLGVSRQIATDWLKLRKEKKAAVSKTALDGIEIEVAKAGITLSVALMECCARGWAGFKAKWVIENPRASPNLKDAWFSTEKGTLEKGKSIGLEPDRGESLNDFKARIIKHMDAHDGGAR